jgi:hypothetical protein
MLTTKLFLVSATILPAVTSRSHCEQVAQRFPFPYELPGNSRRVKYRKVKLSLWQAVEAYGLWDVDTPTLSRQSAHRWRWGYQSYAPAALPSSPQEDCWYSFLLEAESTRRPQCGWKDRVKWEKKKQKTKKKHWCREPNTRLIAQCIDLH